LIDPELYLEEDLDDRTEAIDTEYYHLGWSPHWSVEGENV
jgi:hypothetical protein